MPKRKIRGVLDHHRPPDCPLCGGIHFGSVGCPLLGHAVCNDCGGPIGERAPRYFGSALSGLYGRTFCVNCGARRPATEAYLSQTVAA